MFVIGQHKRFVFYAESDAECVRWMAQIERALVISNCHDSGLDPSRAMSRSMSSDNHGSSLAAKRVFKHSRSETMMSDGEIDWDVEEEDEEDADRYNNNIR